MRPLALADSCPSDGPARPGANGRWLWAGRVRRLVWDHRQPSPGLAVVVPVRPEQRAVVLISLFLLAGSMVQGGSVAVLSTLRCACAGGAASPSQPGGSQLIPVGQSHLPD